MPTYPDVALLSTVVQYVYGGLTIRSATIIDQLRVLSDGMNGADLDLLLSMAPAPVPESGVTLEGRYRLRIGRIGADWIFASRLDGVFVLDMARRTLACHVDHPDDVAWQDVLVRRVLPRIAVLLGGHAVHAAAVASDHGALLLVGRSGAGKSTLTASLGNAGWGVLSDDIAILRATPAGTIVAPVHRGVAIWEASRAGLALPRAACHALAGYDGKVRFSPPDDENPADRPLRAILMLERRADIAVPEAIPLPTAEALRIVARQTIHVDPTAAPDAASAAVFAQLAAAIRRTPAFRLLYPDDFTALPSVESLLRTLIAKLGAPS